MAARAAQTHLTPEEYIALERKAPPDAEIIRYEYLNGELIAMSGASRAHNLITGNICAKLHSLLKGSRRETYMNAMRVSAPVTSSYFYPDVVVCEDPRFEDDVFDILLNPIILVEVLSPSTEAYDRGEKFSHYRHLASLQEYILVSQDKVLVERYRRPEKKMRPPRLLHKTGFSPLSKHLRTFCHSPPSNANCPYKKSTNACRFLIRILENYKTDFEGG